MRAASARCARAVTLSASAKASAALSRTSTRKICACVEKVLRSCSVRSEHIYGFGLSSFGMRVHVEGHLPKNFLRKFQTEIFLKIFFVIIDESFIVFSVYNCVLGVPRDHPDGTLSRLCRSESRSSILENPMNFLRIPKMLLMRRPTLTPPLAVINSLRTHDKRLL